MEGSTEGTTEERPVEIVRVGRYTLRIDGVFVVVMSPAQERTLRALDPATLRRVVGLYQRTRQ